MSESGWLFTVTLARAGPTRTRNRTLQDVAGTDS
jgi:hypothetical protein